MTKKAPKPTAQHMQKLADLMDTRPEGVSLRQVQNALSVSPTLAKAALIEIGAVKQDGKWVFAEVEPEPVTIAESAPVEPVTIKPEPQLKKLTQAVFEGLPSEYQWAAVDGYNGAACAYIFEPSIRDGDDQFSVAGGDYLFVGDGYDATDWQNSLIEREPTVAEIVEAFAANPPDFEPLIKSVAVAKSDFAVALEAERQRVFDAVAIGGTAERLAELTGLHVDDVQIHLDVLIDDGAIFREPIIIGYGHKVAV